MAVSKLDGPSWPSLRRLWKSVNELLTFVSTLYWAAPQPEQNRHGYFRWAVPWHNCLLVATSLSALQTAVLLSGHFRNFGYMTDCSGTCGSEDQRG